MYASSSPLLLPHPKLELQQVPVLQAVGVERVGPPLVVAVPQHLRPWVSRSACLQHLQGKARAYVCGGNVSARRQWLWVSRGACLQHLRGKARVRVCGGNASVRQGKG